MIFDISDYKFKRIFEDTFFHLPIRWDGRDFSETLSNLYDRYLDRLRLLLPKDYIKDIQRDCDLIIRAVNHQLNGFPSKAYNSMEKLMSRMIVSPVVDHFRNSIDVLQDGKSIELEPLYLFRATTVPDNQPYPRERIFHTPYNLRSCVSTNRYSIAGFPSLYLGTSLELCCEEIHLNPHKGFGIAARFEPNGYQMYQDRPISFIDLAIKPQDFLRIQVDNSSKKGRRVNEETLLNPDARGAYLFWYPLIAACSFIRVNRDTPFAAEYIIPQLLM